LIFIKYYNLYHHLKDVKKKYIKNKNQLIIFLGRILREGILTYNLHIFALPSFLPIFKT